MRADEHAVSTATPAPFMPRTNESRLAAIELAARNLQESAARDGVGVLFVGVVPRVLWNGLVVGAATPLKSVGFYLARDGVILELFDEVARSTSGGSAAAAASITIG